VATPASFKRALQREANAGAATEARPYKVLAGEQLCLSAHLSAAGSADFRLKMAAHWLRTDIFPESVHMPGVRI
jgi:hypothetical protein